MLAAYGVGTFAISRGTLLHRSRGRSSDLISLALWSWCTDRSPSRRTLFLIGLLVITGATAMLWRAPGIVWQIVGRLLQGVAAAICWITGLAMIAHAVGEKHVGEYLSYPSVGMMIGTYVSAQIELCHLNIAIRC